MVTEEVALTPRELVTVRVKVVVAVRVRLAVVAGEDPGAKVPAEVAGLTVTLPPVFPEKVAVRVKGVPEPTVVVLAVSAAVGGAYTVTVRGVEAYPEG
jgi:hypothetical protein